MQKNEEGNASITTRVHTKKNYRYYQAEGVP